VQVFVFDLLPYAEPLDDLVHGSALPYPLGKSHFKPEVAVRTYAEHLEAWELMDRLGYDGVGFNEHHTSPYGLMNSPNLMASAASQRTKRLKLLIYGNLLPLHQPLRLAEELAMIDCLSNGRLIAGVARGIPREYAVHSIPMAQSRARFEEAFEIITRAWTEEVFSFEGKFHSYKDIALWPRPVQQPHPPIWIPSQGSGETIAWASHPSRKYTYLQTFSPVDQLARFLALYYQQAEKYGYQASTQQLGWATPVYVSDSDEAARREARPHIEAFYNKFLRMPVEMLLPPGYLSLASMQAVTDKIRSGPAAGGYTIEDLSAKGMIICGSPDSVAQQLETYQKQVKFGKLIAMTQFGTLPHDLTVRSMELFARKVMPRLRHIGEESAPTQVHAAE
jgi:alkanesulfonate monooxygenase SsuD/methylene tetrahydromethanopterin reductase-like flavin-dependent oxidoreductase (luciferase family)